VSEPTNGEPVKENALLILAKRISYAEEQVKASERKLATLKQNYEVEVASIRATVDRFRHEIHDLSKQAVVEAEALRSLGYSVPPLVVPPEPRAPRKALSKDEATRRLGPIVWNVEGHNVLRREIVRYITNRAVTRYPDFEAFYVGAGGAAGTAHSVWGSILAYGRTKGWVRGEGGRADPFFISHATNGIDLTTASSAEREKFLAEAAATREASG
jgi:hypothetical protein